MSKGTRQLGTRAEAVSSLGVWRQPVSNSQRMSEAPPNRFVGEARPGVLLRPVWGRARAHEGSSLRGLVPGTRSHACGPHVVALGRSPNVLGG